MACMQMIKFSASQQRLGHGGASGIHRPESATNEANTCKKLMQS